MKTCILLIFLQFQSFSFAQSTPNQDINSFEIIIENTNNGFKLKSSHGSRWTDLSFSTLLSKAQKISEEGMESSHQDTISTENNIADYLFSISKKNDIITLIGLKGTSWEKLSFSLPINKTQKINQDGMVK